MATRIGTAGDDMPIGITGEDTFDIPKGDGATDADFTAKLAGVPALDATAFVP